MIKKFLILIVFLSFSIAFSQNKKDNVLLTIKEEPVYTSEFLRVFNKNRDIVNEENKKNIDEYLDLFINYKLKLQEAKDLKLDTIPSYLQEFNKYKKQLIAPYLKDRKVTEKLVKEAYNRLTEEINASHILITLPPNASPKDTLQAYNTLLEARNKILNGESFEDVAKKYSKDPSAKQNGGNLGYFTAFSMVYPFETATYNTKKGNVSMPFRTQFGYHIVKVNDCRPSKGEIKVAHIMIREKKNDPNYAKKQITDIYNKFKQGASFEKLAKQYSDDKMSAMKGGELKRFSYGRMIPEFADIAFSLKEKGDVSKPFKTKFGWHIVKLIDRYPVKSFDELHSFITKKIEKGERSVIVGKSMANKLKKKYDVKINKKGLNSYLNKPKDNSINQEILFSVKEKKYRISDLKNYLNKNRKKTYIDFIDAKVLEYYKNHLAEENQEYAYTLKEYQDGLLLFDLLQKKIWTKAESDTIGLQNFYKQNQSKYKWKKRVEASIASCTQKEKCQQVKNLLEANIPIDQIKNKVNNGATIHVLFTSGSFEINDEKLPKNLDIKKGVSKIIHEGKDDFKVVKINKIVPESIKKLAETKGKVISDYQDFLEKEWIKELHHKYPIKLNKKEFKKLKKKYQ
ncbi:MAG TPA: peptidylprolyl isomerase [Flavobacteriia bacterium]|nr:peptidylprolyl isomerase [Flavobacteriia bacterium]